MPIVTAGMNDTWFWFEATTRGSMLGTAEDCMRKVELFADKGQIGDGIEIYLCPSKIRDSEEFSDDFIAAFRAMERRVVHIGDPDPDFLLRDGATELMARFRTILDELQAEAIVLHAHHFKHDLATATTVLRETMGPVDVLVENNGADDAWAYSVEGLKAIFRVGQEFGLCLDICHIKDLPDHRLRDYLEEPELESRIAQIHYSFSPARAEADPYETAGYHDYGALHELWALTGLRPSQDTLDFVRQYPVVMEGVIPTEDPEMAGLAREREILKGT